MAQGLKVGVNRERWFASKLAPTKNGDAIQPPIKCLSGW